MEIKLYDCTACDRTGCTHKDSLRRLPAANKGLGLCPNLQNSRIFIVTINQSHWRTGQLAGTNVAVIRAADEEQARRLANLHFANELSYGMEIIEVVDQLVLSTYIPR